MPRTAKKSVAAPGAPDNIERLQEAGRALSRKLGHPLRTEIPDPLSDADWEELILARMLDYENHRPAEELLEEFAYLRRKPRKNLRRKPRKKPQ